MSVNGHPIPFNMKIGEAGEAFFIFETDDDIPDDLITSPLLEPTRNGGATDADVPTDRFGAKLDKDVEGEPQAKVPEESQEPDFLDLNAAPRDQTKPLTPPEEKAAEDLNPEASASLPSPPPSPTTGVTPSSLLARTGTKMDPHSQVDEALQSTQCEVRAPEITYKHGQ